MPSANFLYGARSGIQKAVRRGDVSLARTCFDTLWPIPEHRKWLLWRIPVLVVEDCWIMSGELAKAQAAAKELSASSDELQRHWLKFIIQLTIATKAQDAAWLWYLAKCESGNPLDHAEWQMMREVVLMVEEGNPEVLPSKFPHDRFEAFLRSRVRRELTPYEELAFAAVEARRRTGGMVADQWNCMSAALLIFMRGLPEATVQGMLQNQKGKYAGARVKCVTDLPWFCFDMHTRPGLRAASAFRKREANSLPFDKDKLNGAWFQLTSAKICPQVIGEILDWRAVPHPNCLQTVWLTEKREAIARELGMSLAQLEDYWLNVGEPKMRELIHWALVNV